MQDTLNKYLEQFPSEVTAAKQQTMALFKAGKIDALHDLVRRAQVTVRQWQASSKNQQTQMADQVVKAQITLLVVEKYCRAALAKTQDGVVELSKWDQTIAQHLFFTRKHERRSPSVRMFQFWWRFIRNKTAVMSAVQSLGIYCVYSTDLARQLKHIIGGRSCLEIAAGDGTLSLLLDRQGVRLATTDDHSWAHKVQFPDWVENLSASAALKKFQPQVVLCSWPPAGNDFEKEIFKTPSVQTYIMIGSKHQFAAGNWQTYAAQKNFTWRAAPELAALLLPAELDSEVLVFEAK